MITKVKQSKFKVKEETTSIGMRIPIKVAGRLDKLGLKGTVGSDIIKQFILLKEMEEKINLSSIPNILNSKEGSIIYPTYIRDDLFHITIKKGADIIIAELSGMEIAEHILNIIEILNTNIKPEGN
jgi:hypothetical protein